MTNRKTLPITDEIASVDKDIFQDYIGNTLLNPDKVLKSEGAGKGIELYEDIMRDDQVGSNLQTRKLAVVGKEWEIIPASDRRQDQKIAEFVKTALLGFNFDAARKALLSGIVLGFKPAEIMWKYSEGQVFVGEIIARASRRFVFDKARRLRLVTPENMIEGEELPERKFVVFTNTSENGSPYGDGLGRQLYWPVWFKKNAIKFWMIFADKYGSPTAVGKYPPGTHPDLQAKLLQAIAAIQQEQGVTIPDTMAIELLEATRSGSAGTYESLCAFMNAAISKVLLGQTLTTEMSDKGGSYAASKTHEEVRQEYTKADADALCECLNSSLIPWIVDYNYPDVSEYPKMWIRTETEKDLKPLADRDKVLIVDMGLPVSRKYLYETYAIPEPQDGDDLVAPPRERPPTETPGSADETLEKQEFEDKSAPSIRDMITAQEYIDDISDSALSPGAIDMSALGRIVDKAESFEDLQERLADAYSSIGMDGFRSVLAQAMVLAGLKGRSLT